MIVTFPEPAILVGNFKAALLAASEDEARPIACVRLEIRNKVARFVATDGHWMWINEIRCDAEGEAIIHFAIDDAKQIVKILDCSKKASAWNVEVDTDVRIVRQLSKTVTYLACDRVYPPYAQILPTKLGGGRIVAGFDAQLMGKITAAFVLAACKRKGAPVCLAFHTQEDVKHRDGSVKPEPIVITASGSSEAAHALVVLMPFKHDATAPETLASKYGKA